jgi:superfamily II DNA or RNA helicase
MTYFSENYSKISYPFETADSRGLRNAQIGAIHAIASHFTIHDKEPAIVVMPTGAGKTAVLYLSAYVLQVNRVLVITPGKLVRNQISEGFASVIAQLPFGY